MSDFNEKVYMAVRQIPAGQVASYGQIADFLDAPRHARMVGRALSHSPKNVPAHRVIKKSGELPPENVFGGTRQRTLLEQEGVPFKANGQVDMATCMWKSPFYYHSSE
ncbi:MGMT family protein [Alkalihalobacillus pseudalcaliphilus]|uniref:MGMT family protein n=1 Tax=Alkalihalobacillus pseudalcaliphilus TaxID=79884 RepID=UPI00064D8DBA|nr:MGMT family protein [Alkalihalobacillus pseudalcaliphilus]KMK77929.1 cysteine methyltransferase [Alkalihalobacillus pseudalcaliphilus]